MYWSSPSAERLPTKTREAPACSLLTSRDIEPRNTSLGAKRAPAQCPKRARSWFTKTRGARRSEAPDWSSCACNAAGMLMRSTAPRRRLGPGSKRSPWTTLRCNRCNRDGGCRHLGWSWALASTADDAPYHPRRLVRRGLPPSTRSASGTTISSSRAARHGNQPAVAPGRRPSSTRTPSDRVRPRGRLQIDFDEAFAIHPRLQARDQRAARAIPKRGAPCPRTGCGRGPQSTTTAAVRAERLAKARESSPLICFGSPHRHDRPCVARSNLVVHRVENYGDDLEARDRAAPRTAPHLGPPDRPSRNSLRRPLAERRRSLPRRRVSCILSRVAPSRVSAIHGSLEPRRGRWRCARGS